jgi:succinyl-CoA synthetase beta subunit
MTFPRWFVASSEEEAVNAAVEISKKVEIEPLILTDQRDFKTANNPDEAKQITKSLLGQEIEEQKVKRVIVQEHTESSDEVYAYVSIDRYEEKPMVFLSKYDMENIYSSRFLQSKGVPFKHFTIPQGILQFETRELAKAAGMKKGQIASVGGLLWNLHRIWMKYDIEVIGAVPIVFVEGKPVIKKVSVRIDEDAAFRHKELKLEEEIDELQSDREKTLEGMGTPYIELKGDVGMIVAGSGMGIAANDVITLYGQEPANMSDIGGGPKQERVAALVEEVLKNPMVNKVLVYYFGGISLCDVFAKGLLTALEKCDKPKPIVIKLAGTNQKEGHDIIRSALAENPRMGEFVKSLHGEDYTIDQLAKGVAEFT